MINTNKILNRLVYFFLSLVLGVVLWKLSDAPPFGSPLSEFNDNFWGPLANIADKWRLGQFDFWDRGIGAGGSLYLMGRYPIFNPFYAASWFLDNGWLLLFMFIVPYAMGFFFSALVLSECLGLSWLYTIFGALSYLGLSTAINVALSEQPIFLFGNFLFPAMIYVLFKIQKKPLIVQAILIGAMISLQFALAGIIQFFQLICWWLFYFLVEGLLTTTIKQNKFIRWVIASCLLVVFAVGVFGLQIIPTIYYALTGAGRTPDALYYPINNLSIPMFLDYMNRTFVNTSLQSSRIMTQILLAGLIIFVAHYRFLKQQFKDFPVLWKSWLAVILFFVFPTVAQFLSQLHPLLFKVLSPLSTFTFKYGLHILDFIMVMTICFVLSKGEKLVFKNLNLWQKIIIGLLGSLIILNVVAPVFVGGMELNNKILKTIAFGIFGLFLVYCILKKPTSKVLQYVFMVMLLVIGFVRAYNSYIYHDKGQRRDLSKFGFDRPEVQYYQNARGKFFLPQNYDTFVMSFNYNLLYGVHGTMGFESLSPIRFNTFLAQYNAIGGLPKATKYPATLYIYSTTEELASYFPVNFTNAKKSQTVPWKGFVKKVEGTKFNIWENQHAIEYVRKANSLECVSFDHVINKLKHQFVNSQIYVALEDCQQFNLQNKSFRSTESTKISDYDHQSGDKIKFKVSASDAGYLILTDMYQKGWVAKLNGKDIPIFPANYLFIGFEIPEGDYQVELKFVPPLFAFGFVGSVLSLVGLIFAWFLIKKP